MSGMLVDQIETILTLCNDIALSELPDYTQCRQAILSICQLLLNQRLNLAQRRTLCLNGRCYRKLFRLWEYISFVAHRRLRRLARQNCCWGVVVFFLFKRWTKSTALVLTYRSRCMV